MKYEKKRSPGQGPSPRGVQSPRNSPNRARRGALPLFWLVGKFDFSYTTIVAPSFLRKTIVNPAGVRLEDPSGRLLSLLKSSFLGESPKKRQASEETSELVENLKEFTTTTVQEVMVPRARMTSIAKDKTLAEAMALHYESGHSRIPVHDERRDNIVGILYSIDLFPFVSDPGSKRVEDVMRSPLFISYSQPIPELLQRFKKEHKHMAIVIDEYGGVDGVVTMVDILEELVGDIPDEFDRAEPSYEEVEDGLIIIDASYPLDEFNELYHTAFEKEGVETIGGYLCHVEGKIPEKNESIKVGDLLFTVEESSERSLLKLRLPIPKVG